MMDEFTWWKWVEMLWRNSFQRFLDNFFVHPDEILPSVVHWQRSALGMILNNIQSHLRKISVESHPKSFDFFPLDTNDRRTTRKHWLQTWSKQRKGKVYGIFHLVAWYLFLPTFHPSTSSTSLRRQSLLFEHRWFLPRIEWNIPKTYPRRMHKRVEHNRGIK